MDQTAQQRREQIEEEAALWVVRASEHGPGSVGGKGLEAWLAASPEHELAYMRQLRAWRVADHAVADAEPARSAVLDFARKHVRPPHRRELRSHLRRAAAWAALAFGAAALAGGLWLTNTGTAYATAVGEHRVVRLQDGSRVEMNTATRMVVRYTLTGRNIQLQTGEALFEVAPNKNRPFNVIVNREQVRAVGTAFNVRVRPQGLDVLVSKGVVDVGPKDAGAHRQLTAGSMVSIAGDGQVIQRVSAAEIERTLAWRYGAIALNGQSLGQAAAEFNRYNMRQLKVADPQIADLKLGGYFRADDLDNFVQALRTTFGVEVTPGDDQTLYLSRAR